MAEVVAIVSSALGIAEAGVELSSTLYQFASKVQSAKKDVRNIARDVSLTSTILDEIGSNLKKDRRLGVCSVKFLRDANHTVGDCRDAFTQIETTLKESLKTADLADTRADEVKMRRWDRVKWPLVQPKMELMRCDLDRLKANLQLMLSVLLHAHNIRGARSGKDGKHNPHQPYRVRADDIRELQLQVAESEKKYAKLRAKVAGKEKASSAKENLSSGASASPSASDSSITSSYDSDTSSMSSFSRRRTARRKARAKEARQRAKWHKRQDSARRPSNGVADQILNESQLLGDLTRIERLIDKIDRVQEKLALDEGKENGASLEPQPSPTGATAATSQVGGSKDTEKTLPNQTQGPAPGQTNGNKAGPARPLLEKIGFRSSREGKALINGQHDDQAQHQTAGPSSPPDKDETDSRPAEGPDANGKLTTPLKDETQLANSNIKESEIIAVKDMQDPRICDLHEKYDQDRNSSRKSHVRTNPGDFVVEGWTLSKVDKKAGWHRVLRYRMPVGHLELLSELRLHQQQKHGIIKVIQGLPHTLQEQIARLLQDKRDHDEDAASFWAACAVIKESRLARLPFAKHGRDSVHVLIQRQKDRNLLGLWTSSAAANAYTARPYSQSGSGSTRGSSPGGGPSSGEGGLLENDRSLVKNATNPSDRDKEASIPRTPPLQPTPPSRPNPAPTRLDFPPSSSGPVQSKASATASPPNRLLKAAKDVSTRSRSRAASKKGRESREQDAQSPERSRGSTVYPPPPIIGNGPPAPLLPPPLPAPYFDESMPYRGRPTSYFNNSFDPDPIHPYSRSRTMSDYQPSHRPRYLEWNPTSPVYGPGPYGFDPYNPDPYGSRVPHQRGMSYGRQSSIHQPYAFPYYGSEPIPSQYSPPPPPRRREPPNRERSGVSFVDDDRDYPAPERRRGKRRSSPVRVVERNTTVLPIPEYGSSATGNAGYRPDPPREEQDEGYNSRTRPYQKEGMFVASNTKPVPAPTRQPTVTDAEIEQSGNHDKFDERSSGEEQRKKRDAEAGRKARIARIEEEKERKVKELRALEEEKLKTAKEAEERRYAASNRPVVVRQGSETAPEVRTWELPSRSILPAPYRSPQSSYDDYSYGAWPRNENNLAMIPLGWQHPPPLETYGPYPGYRPFEPAHYSALRPSPPPPPPNVLGPGDGYSMNDILGRRNPIVVDRNTAVVNEQNSPPPPLRRASTRPDTGRNEVVIREYRRSDSGSRSRSRSRTRATRVHSRANTRNKPSRRSTRRSSTSPNSATSPVDRLLLEWTNVYDEPAEISGDEEVEVVEEALPRRSRSRSRSGSRTRSRRRRSSPSTVSSLTTSGSSMSSVNSTDSRATRMKKFREKRRKERPRR